VTNESDYSLTNQPSYTQMYRDNRISGGLPAATPWDIGRPQPVVEKLVAHGAIRGKVLDPGTGPGHHAIYYASQGFSATGIDSIDEAIERAKANADAAGVSVDFRVADATKLEGLDNTFDTVVDCAFYHLFARDADSQLAYMTALHRATTPQAHLYLFAWGQHNVNGITTPEGVPETSFRDILPAAGWNITYLGLTTYLANIDLATIEGFVAQEPDNRPHAQALLTQLRTIEPLRVDGLIYFPFWELHATRTD
jgi:SAM-dependent methyltransferase